MNRPNIFFSLLALLLIAAFSLHGASVGFSPPGYGSRLFPAKPADHPIIESPVPAQAVLRFQSGDKGAHGDKDAPGDGSSWDVILTAGCSFSFSAGVGTMAAERFLSRRLALRDAFQPRAPPSA